MDDAPNPGLDPETLESVVACFDVVRDGDSVKLADLLNHGLPANLTNDKGDTLLILAAYHKHLKCIDLLLEAGADHSRINDRGQTALGSAVFRQDVKAVKRLLAAGAEPGGGSPSAIEVAKQFELGEMLELLSNR